MTQEEINKKCLDYIELITNIGHNRVVDHAVALYSGLEDIDFTPEDLRELKDGYKLFWKADESIPDFEGLVRKKRRKIIDGKEK